MNRNTLLIAIAAIAVVGIAVGLFLSGALTAGPLSGTIGAIPTTLTLGWTDLGEQGLGGYEFRLYGRLADSTGAPVAGRTVRLTFTVPGETPAPTTGWWTVSPSPTVTPIVHDVGTATTGADGSYSVYHTQYASYYGKHPVYSASFAGDGTYLASRSPGVQGP
jgi:hypothetical protein